MTRIITFGVAFVFALILSSTRFSLAQITVPPSPAAPTPQTLQEGAEDAGSEKTDEMKGKGKAAEEKTKGSVKEGKSKVGGKAQMIQECKEKILNDTAILEADREQKTKECIEQGKAEHKAMKNEKKR